MVPKMHVRQKESPGISAGASHQVTRLPLSEPNSSPALPILARAADILESPVFWSVLVLLCNVVALVSFLAGAR